MGGRAGGALALQVEREEWEALSACADLNTDLFYPAGSSAKYHGQIAAAKAVCAACPVEVECLEFALETNEEFGIWGGETEDSRRRLRREFGLMGPSRRMG